MCQGSFCLINDDDAICLDGDDGTSNVFNLTQIENEVIAMPVINNIMERA